VLIQPTVTSCYNKSKLSQIITISIIYNIIKEKYTETQECHNQLYVSNLFNRGQGSGEKWYSMYKSDPMAKSGKLGSWQIWDFLTQRSKAKRYSPCDVRWQSKNCSRDTFFTEFLILSETWFPNRDLMDQGACRLKSSHAMTSRTLV
jgi:hypothetical protein